MDPIRRARGEFYERRSHSAKEGWERHCREGMSDAPDRRISAREARVREAPVPKAPLTRARIAFEFARDMDPAQDMHFHQALLLYRSAGVRPEDIASDFRDADVWEVIDWMEGRNPPRSAWRKSILEIASTHLRRHERIVLSKK